MTEVEMNPLNVLISLHRGYGLGDAVQMSAVLQHVAKYRPNWRVDYVAESGKHQVGRGIVANTRLYDGVPHFAHYDAEVQILLFDTWANWGDRPNTRVSSCLHEGFGLPWDAECGRYRVDVTPEARKRALAFLPPEGRIHARWKYESPITTNYVAIHYEGDSSPARKNLQHEQAADMCDAVERLGRMPLLLDWRNRSPLPQGLDVATTGWCPDGNASGHNWGGDAEMNCAVISQCEAFVGIDSGPSKCASATDTPALVVWTGHHPAPFHDPAPNTTHLVPKGYHGLEPVCSDRGVVEWFEEHYCIRQYIGDPIVEVKRWLREVLC